MALTVPQFLGLVRRWWWILLLGPLLGGLVGYGTSTVAEPVYSSRVLVQINAPQSNGTVDPDSVQSTLTLATTYRQLVGTSPVLQPVIDELGLPYDVDYLQQQVDAWNIQGTQLIEIQVWDNDPEMAADIANAVAASLATRVADQSILLGSPIHSVLDTQITQTTDRITLLEQQIATLDSDDPSVQSQREQLQSELAELQQRLAELTFQQQTLDLNSAAAQSQVTVANAAEPATVPDEPRPRLSAILGAMFGGLVAAIVVVGLGYLDKTVRSTTNFRALGAPLIAGLSDQNDLGMGEGQLFVRHDPDGPAAHAIQQLRAFVDLTLPANTVTSLAVTSPDVDDGKSTLIANLATAMAMAGRKTVLVDANLRRPALHRIMGIRNSRGLSYWLRHPSLPWQDVAEMTGLPNLWLLPSGSILQNSTGTFNQERFRQLLRSIETDVDVILVDTPALLQSNDALYVTSEVGSVIVVVRDGYTRRDQVQEVVARLQSSARLVLGIVLNRRAIQVRQ